MASSWDRHSVPAALAVASVGIEMGVAIGFGWWIGSKFDEWLETGPWLMYVFLALGIAAAFRGLWRTARKYGPKDDGP